MQVHHSTELNTDARSWVSPCPSGHACKKCRRKQQEWHWQQVEGDFKSRHPGRDGLMRSQQRQLQAPDVGLVAAPPVAGCAALGDLRLSLGHIEMAGLGRCLQVGVLHGQAPGGGGGLAEAAPDAHQVAALQVAAPAEGNNESRCTLPMVSTAWQTFQLWVMYACLALSGNGLDMHRTCVPAKGDLSTATDVPIPCQSACSLASPREAGYACRVGKANISAAHRSTAPW